MHTPSDRPNLQALRRWSRLIQTAAAGVLVLSAVLMLAPSVGERFFYLVYFRQSVSPVRLPDPAQGYIQFAHGILGAVMAGWMIAIITLARGPFMAGERYAWNAIAWPLSGWYVIDTCFSLAHGVWGNVLLNTVLAVLFAIPLLRSRPLFVQRARISPCSEMRGLGG